ncbi:hypothetical protein MJN47_32510, partial [Salmonella enterica subsp. enterica serovar Lubbock]|nr:hypothetical protein [Salmonella enterica subsp. enterica serovar Lubbock]
SLLARNPSLTAATLDDIYWGCVQQTLEQGFNIARNAALLAEITHIKMHFAVKKLSGSGYLRIHLPLIPWTYSPGLARSTSF